MTINHEAESSTKPLILVCNDDGIDAPGIYALAAAMDIIGDVFVVAPIDEQSAVGHAITVRDPVRARPWRFELPSGTVPAFAVTGTPADCAKLAITHLLPRPPELVVRQRGYRGIDPGARRHCLLALRLEDRRL